MLFLEAAFPYVKCKECKTCRGPQLSDFSFLTLNVDTYIPSKAGGDPMKLKREFLIGLTFLVLIAALAIGQKILQSRAVEWIADTCV